MRLCSYVLRACQCNCVPAYLCAHVKTPSQAGRRVFSPLATKQAPSALTDRSACSHFLLWDSTHTVSPRGAPSICLTGAPGNRRQIWRSEAHVLRSGSRGRPGSAGRQGE
ncbi:unnamed protein product, partial [Rangifer tarandus platyrhynchus]